jgi:catechol 2,3-dioxygenase-like lactoylglutathione lyase family enzyme
MGYDRPLLLKAGVAMRGRSLKRLMTSAFALALALASGVAATLSPIGAGAQVNPFGLKPHHITATVLDLDRAEAWYRDMLGFAVRERGSHGAVRFVELAIPGFGVALVKQPATDSNNRPVPPTAPRWLHIVFSVPNPNAAYRALKDRGASVSTRQDSAKESVSSFLIEDSEGNEIEIVADAAY